MQNLSGGELQRVAITLALGTPADIYLIDEPSAYLDSEQRIIAAKVCALASTCSTIKVPVQDTCTEDVCIHYRALAYPPILQAALYSWWLLVSSGGL